MWPISACAPVVFQPQLLHELDVLLPAVIVITCHLQHTGELCERHSTVHGS